MNAHSFFNQHSVFRFNEFKAYMEGRGEGTTMKNCYMTLYNYCQKGKLIHVRKGLYVVASDLFFDSKTTHPFLIAGKATDDAVLAYHTALESHGVAYTDFNEHTYLTTRRTPDFLFQNQQYRAIYLPSLSQANKSIETVTIEGMTIRRTDLECTLVDVLDRPNLSGGWEEVIRSLDRIINFNPTQAIDYALSLRRASIVAKLGYFLEYQRPDYLHMDASLLERLRQYIPKHPYYIERKSSIGQGSYIKKWKIIVPNYLHYRQWEEPEI